MPVEDDLEVKLIQVVCLTNVDLKLCERFPKELPVLPRVGDLIESAYLWNRRCKIELEVVQVIWKYNHSDCRSYEFPEKEWYPEIRLGIPGTTETLDEWHQRYHRIQEG